MKIEIVVVVGIVLFLFLFSIWYNFSSRRLRKKYNLDNDISKKGGVDRGKFEEGNFNVTKATDNFARSTQSTERELSMAPTFNDIREDSNFSRSVFEKMMSRK